MSTTEQTQQQQGLPTGTWATDSVHSEIGFSVDYMAGTFRGTFSNFEARLDGGAIEGSAEVPSVHVKDANLEAHLQGPDFFDAERNPRLTFTSQNVRRTGDEVMIAGEITIRGETQPLNLKGTLKDPITDPFGNERFGLSSRGCSTARSSASSGTTRCRVAMPRSQTR